MPLLLQAEDKVELVGAEHGTQVEEREAVELLLIHIQ
jgi:hypothetical protein